MTNRVIQVRGAREHNLRSIDVDIPRNQIVAITGVSGSGKSSLAFATIHAFSQRHLLDSIAPFARRLIDQLPEPRVDDVRGLPPTIALQQRRSAGSARSSVGTLTTISNNMRMLFARAGTYPDGAAPLDSDAFSPNTPAGACPECHGVGEVHDTTESSLVPDPSLSIRDRAIAAWPGAWQGKNYRDILGVLGYDLDTPWQQLAAADREWILFTDEQPVVTVHAEREAHRIQRPYQGTYMSPRRYVLKTLAQSASEQQRSRALKHVVTRPCDACEGSRLSWPARDVRFLGKRMYDLGSMELSDVNAMLQQYLAEMTGGASAEDVTAAAAVQIVRIICEQLEPLIELGVGHLSLDRSIRATSAGEQQRVRLAAQTRSPLFGVVYVLDEPGAGLHPSDVESMFRVLRRIQYGGNSVLLVEHDLDLIERCDWVIDIGPNSGINGGEVTFSGRVGELRSATPTSLTGVHLAHRPHLVDSSLRREPRTPNGTYSLKDVSHHNLRNISIDVPLGLMTSIIGVSGAGKSSLLHALADAVSEDRASGVRRVVTIDQTPIGRTPRSNVATYTGLFDIIRTAFAATSDARERGYKAGRFSFNVAGGRCETCEGAGQVQVELLHLPGVSAPCQSCHGARFNDETLAVRWNGHTIADVLALSVDDAVQQFSSLPKAIRILSALQELGLGYIQLGQPAPELSGGEAQRIRLASALHQSTRSSTLYLLDEPTSGLHPADREHLASVLQRITDTGHTVVVAEHDMMIASLADHMIEIGPGGGVNGGRVIAAGTPHDLASNTESASAQYLARVLGQ